jgi:putative transposase
MEHSHRYHAYPTQEVAAKLEHHLNVHLQLYNNVRWDYEQVSQEDKPSEYDQNNKLPKWKQRWSVFGELYSKAAQATVARFHRNLSNHLNPRRFTSVVFSYLTSHVMLLERVERT